jgi:hypothetical protein
MPGTLDLSLLVPRLLPIVRYAVLPGCSGFKKCFRLPGWSAERVWWRDSETTSRFPSRNKTGNAAFSRIEDPCDPPD